MGRFLTEIAHCLKRSGYQVCFTIFGPPMLGSQARFLNVVGCAYSNLFYPDIDFWCDLTPFRRIVRQSVDRYRFWGTAQADYWIFETEALRQRAIDLCGFPQNRVGVVRMAVSSLVSKARVDLRRRAQLDSLLPGGFRFLFLSSAIPNKRVHCAAAIAVELTRTPNLPDFVFVTTLDHGAAYTKQVVEAFAAAGMSQRLLNVGTVATDDVASLIDCCDGMCNFARLESFSNNFVEAWQMERPLVTTESDWARAACGDGALYINPEHPAQAALAIARLMSDAEERRRLIASGTRQLATYPDARQKTLLYLGQIQKAISLGPCTPAERSTIRWAFGTGGNQH